MCAHTPARRGKRARVTPRASGGARARRCWSDEPVASGSPEATARVAMSGGAAEQAGGGAVVRSARAAQAACFFLLRSSEKPQPILRVLVQILPKFGQQRVGERV